MKPAPFEFVRAQTVAEALSALQHEDAKIIAGGQSLVPMMNFRLAQPARLVDINGIAGLGDIRAQDGKVVVGALVRHVEAMRSAELGRSFPVIAEAMAHVAHLSIRNRGTIGGSLVHADPSAEWPLLVALLDGTVVMEGPDGRREAGADEFFIAPLFTDLGEDELVVAVSFPVPQAGSGQAFDEVARRAGDFAIVSAGALVRVEAGIFREVRLALGGVGDGPARARALETALVGQRADADAIAGVADLAREDLEPESDVHASAEYRLHLVSVLARRVLGRALGHALERARGAGA